MVMDQWEGQDQFCLSCREVGALKGYRTQTREMGITTDEEMAEPESLEEWRTCRTFLAWLIQELRDRESPSDQHQHSGLRARKGLHIPTSLFLLCHSGICIPSSPPPHPEPSVASRMSRKPSTCLPCFSISSISCDSALKPSDSLWMFSYFWRTSPPLKKNAMSRHSRKVFV